MSTARGNPQRNGPNSQRQRSLPTPPQKGPDSQQRSLPTPPQKEDCWANKSLFQNQVEKMGNSPDLPKIVHATHNKIKDIIAELKQVLVERNDAIIACLLAIINLEHVLLFGPPGTGKSLLAELIFRYFRVDNESDGNFFSVVFHSGTTLDDIVGPVDLAELEKNNYLRNRNGKLCAPDCHFSFLDELFKAQREVLSVLLPVLNERRFNDGHRNHNLPIKSIITASNEVPIEAGQQALYDRLLFRVFTVPISDHLAMWKSMKSPPKNIQIEKC